MLAFPSLSQINDKTELWGGKAIGISILQKNGLSVPEGFVISSTFYSDYINNKLDIFKFGNILDKSIHKYFFNRPWIIFRSSANIEGADDSCCCGVFESIVHSEGNYINDVKKVWDSVNSPEALAYFDLMHIDANKVKMSVIVQEMKVETISGIIQTRDVVNDLPKTLLEYEYDTVNAVVDGNSDAGLMVFNDNDELVEGTYPKSLSIDCFNSLLNKCRTIEKLLLTPVEIEFQLSEKQLFFTQVRNLT